MMFAFFGDIEGLDDVWVVERSRGDRLLAKSRQIGRILDSALRQNLNGPETMHQRVFGQIHTAHAAGTEQTEQLVLPEKESSILALQQIVALPAGEHFGFDELVSQPFGIVHDGDAGLTPCRECLRQVAFFDQATAFDIFNELFRR